MAQINNTSLIRNLINYLKLAPAREKIPTEIADKIVPVFDTKPQPEIQVASATASDSTSATIITTSNDVDTYLVSADLTLVRDSSATSTLSTITATPFGRASTPILSRGYRSLNSSEMFQSGFSFAPIKLERGTTVTITNSAAIASIDTTGTIHFYEVDINE